MSSPPAPDIGPGCGDGTVLIGTVSSVEGRRVRVRLDGQACDSCPEARGCALAAIPKDAEGVELEDTLGVVFGDRVVVRFAHSPAKTACFLYILPSISMLLGALSGTEILVPATGMDATVAGLAGAIFALLAAFIPMARYLRNRDRLTRLVRVCRED